MDTFLVLFAVVGIVICGWGAAVVFSDMTYKSSKAKQGRLEEVKLGLLLSLIAKPKPQEEKPEEVYCETCGVRLLKNKAHKVFVAKWYDTEYHCHEYYCQVHAPKYDENIVDVYYKRMLVDINGRPIVGRKGGKNV